VRRKEEGWGKTLTGYASATTTTIQFGCRGEAEEEVEEEEVRGD